MKGAGAGVMGSAPCACAPRLRGAVAGLAGTPIAPMELAAAAACAVLLRRFAVATSERSSAREPCTAASSPLSSSLVARVSASVFAACIVCKRTRKTRCSTGPVLHKPERLRCND